MAVRGLRASFDICVVSVMWEADAMSRPDRIAISVHIETDIDMEVGDVWPDGDEPDVITAAEVVAVMEKTGSKRRLLEDWNFIGDLAVDVSVSRPNPAYRQNTNLLGDPTPPRFLNEGARAFEPSVRA